MLAAAQAAAGPLATIVAVGDRDRGVLAPCGRCRQILLDLHPNVDVILPRTEGNLTAEAIRDLLPRSYFAPEPAGGKSISGATQFLADGPLSGLE